MVTIGGGNRMFYAHSENKVGKCETVLEHLSEVTNLCKEFAAEWGCGFEGEIAGLFHDVGKYTETFQMVLKGARKVDHATPGAAAVLFQYRQEGIAAAIAIQGHHDGLQAGDRSSLVESLLMKDKRTKFGKIHSSTKFKELISFLLNDSPKIPNPLNIKSSYVDLSIRGKHIAAMLYVRMLFSALVDADYLATEAQFEGDLTGMRYRERSPSLDSEEIMKKLLDYKNKIEINSTASVEINCLRKDLFDACCIAAESPKESPLTQRRELKQI